MAELLVSLALLAVISTFTISKILTTQQDARRKAVLKETIATVQRVLYDGSVAGDLYPTGLPAYLFAKVNTIKNCPSNANTEGCWTTATQGNLGGGGTGIGFVLSNGAVVSGLDTNNDYGGGDWNEGFVVDWNGTSGPNVEGDDQIYLGFGWGTANGRTYFVGWSAASQTAYENLYSSG